MDLNKIFLIIFFVLAHPAWGKSKLPILATKQTIHNLRFISQDGKYTYYQQSSGKLSLSTNYTVHNLLQGEKNSNFGIYTSYAGKKLLISMDTNYHTFYGVRHLYEIYESDIGQQQINKIGSGIDPRLHLADTWASYYNPYTRSIHFHDLKSKTLQFQITIFNKRNPYFIPDVVMLNEKSVLFTDLNQDGVPGIILFQRDNETLTAVYKHKSNITKLELCSNETHLFIGQFGLEKDSSIFATSKAKPLWDKLPVVYQSAQADLGNMICTATHLFFIKATAEHESEAASILLQDSSLSVLSDLKHVTQLTEMGGRILIPYHGKHYLLYGQHQIDKDNLENTNE